MSKGILNDIDFTNFNVFIDCIKGKQTKAKKIGSHQIYDVLELIHTDICGPFIKLSWNGQQYFISFIENYSIYWYLYLIHEKIRGLGHVQNI